VGLVWCCLLVSGREGVVGPPTFVSGVGERLPAPPRHGDCLAGGGCSWHWVGDGDGDGGQRKEDGPDWSGVKQHPFLLVVDRHMVCGETVDGWGFRKALISLQECCILNRYQYFAKAASFFSTQSSMSSSNTDWNADSMKY